MTDSARCESLIDQQIRMAAERGDFDNLPGMRGGAVARRPIAIEARLSRR